MIGRLDLDQTIEFGVEEVTWFFIHRVSPVCVSVGSRVTVHGSEIDMRGVGDHELCKRMAELRTNVATLCQVEA